MAGVKCKPLRERAVTGLDQQQGQDLPQRVSGDAVREAMQEPCRWGPRQRLRQNAAAWVHLRRERDAVPEARSGR